MNAREMLLCGVAAVALMGGVLAPPAEAQTSVNQSANRGDVATFFAQSAGGRTTCSTSQDTVANLTVTIPAVAGYYAYITGVYITGQSNATGATSTTVWSSTNLTGSPAWLVPFIATAAANPSVIATVNEAYPTGIRAAAPGTAVTILPQATSASAFQCAHVVGYYGPGPQT